MIIDNCIIIISILLLGISIGIMGEGVFFAHWVNTMSTITSPQLYKGTHQMGFC